MPNLALFWHFPTLSDRAVVPSSKVDQLYKTFSKFNLKMPNVPKCQIWHFFWHFSALADRVVVPLTKVDQLCKTFSKLDLKMPNVQKCQIWHILGILKWWQMEWFFI